jgi:hypothetical protein
MKTTHQILLLFSLLLSSCTTGSLTLKNKISKTPTFPLSPHTKIKKDIPEMIFFIKIDGRKYFRTMVSEFSEKDMKELTNAYTKATKKVLKEKHFHPIQTFNQAKSDLVINISLTPFVGSVGVEYLTGLSFGVIPSWVTLKKQYNFDFKYSKTGQEHKYWVNAFRFNHWVVFPIWWTLFLADNQYDKYKEALLDFIENKKSTHNEENSE